jgi:nucleoside-diphosphate-sugar epimerase
MRVLVTGGTGFVGSHAVAALVSAGHQVRLLVRDPAKIDRVLKPRGIEIDDHVIGDMSDTNAVRAALSGCDAVLHAAATLYGGAEILDANVRGVRNALGMGWELGLDPILYVSSIAAMYPPIGDRITVDDPVAHLETTYGRSKAEGERYARELQKSGAPVVTIYPSAAFGPDDPGPGEFVKGLRDGIRFGWPITTSGISIVDVRDLASVVAASLEPGHGPRRFMAAGHFVSWSELADLCDGLTGRRILRVPVSPMLLRGIGRLLDLVKKFVSFEYPLTREAAQLMTDFVRCDNRATVEQLGVEFRSTEQTLADGIRWLYATGQISSRVAGKLSL